MAEEHVAMHQSRRDHPFDWMAVRNAEHTWMWGPFGFEAFDRRRDSGERTPLAEGDPIREDLETGAAPRYAEFLKNALRAPGAPRELDEQSREELRALGYLEDGE